MDTLLNLRFILREDQCVRRADFPEDDTDYVALLRWSGGLVGGLLGIKCSLSFVSFNAAQILPLPFITRSP